MQWWGLVPSDHKQTRRAFCFIWPICCSKPKKKSQTFEKHIFRPPPLNPALPAPNAGFVTYCGTSRSAERVENTSKCTRVPQVRTWFWPDNPLWYFWMWIQEKPYTPKPRPDPGTTHLEDMSLTIPSCGFRCQERMKMALKSLFRTPQNNLRLFKVSFFLFTSVLELTSCTDGLACFGLKTFLRCTIHRFPEKKKQPGTRHYWRYSHKIATRNFWFSIQKLF